jgi:PAS domain S-box-containing protein
MKQTRSTDPAVRSLASGLCNPYQLILLHALVTIVLSYQLLFSPSAVLPFHIQELVVLTLIASVAWLVMIPSRYWAGAWLVGTLVLADTVFTSAIIYASGQASSGLYLAYFLIILLAACAPTLAQMLALSSILCVTYGAILYLEIEQIGGPMEGHLLRIPVLLILAVFYGVTIDAVRRLDREKSILVVDLEEKERMAQALRESKEHFEAFMDNIPAVAFMKDLDGRFIYANKPFERRFMMDRAAWHGKTDSDLWPPTVAKQVREHDQSVMTAHKPFQFTEIMPSNDMGVRSWMVLKFPLRDSSGRQYLGGMALELTEWEQLDEQFRQAQRLEVVGRLAGGVAHDFNNLLMVILGHCELLLTFLSLPDKARGQIVEIKKSGERAASLTQQLLAFSRRQVLQPKIIDLNIIVSNVERMLRRVIGEDIRLETRLGSPLGSVEVDPGQMDQVIMNLAINARDAMPDGGELIIETTSTMFAESAAVEGVKIQTGPYVTLRVTDTGHGMDAETKARVFEPFFTTKEMGKGTGLGLSTVYGIVKQSGGYVFVESVIGEGSRFTVHLPQVQTAPMPQPISEKPGLPKIGWETLLLIEDDATVRSLLYAVLRDQGYRVLEASTGPEALTLMENCQTPIHLLITDMVLPQGMNGREVADRAVQMRSDLKVLYMSGYTEDTILQCGEVRQDAVFLQKPFTPDVFAEKVRKILDQPNPSCLSRTTLPLSLNGGTHHEAVSTPNLAAS